MIIEIYTLKAVAKKVGVSYPYIRKIMTRYKKGEIDNFRGYKFLGMGNKAWIAYPEDLDIRLVDEGEESENLPREEDFADLEK